jgi:hypothetical protein
MMRGYSIERKRVVEGKETETESEFGWDAAWF